MTAVACLLLAGATTFGAEYRWLGPASALDLASTEYMLAGSGPAAQVQELNPMLRSDPLRPTLMLGIAAGEAWGISALSKKHPRWARAWRWTTVAVRGFLAFRNFRIGREVRRLNEEVTR